jgi:pimeloyl-ACP methyl ester carboxylesterase
MAGTESAKMAERQPNMLEVDDTWGRRRLAWMQREATPQGKARAGVFWLCGFNSVMGSSKATALDAWATREGRALTRFDYSGHGQSEGRLEEGTIGQWLADARAAFDRLTDGPQIVVGSSMGGYLALLLGLAKPGRLAGMVLVAPAWNMTERLMWEEMPPETRKILERNGVWMRPSAYGEPYPITKRLIEEGREHLIDLDYLDIGCPLRILHGLKDPDVPFDGSVELIQRQGDVDSRLIAVPDGDHRLAREKDIALLIRIIEEVEADALGT